MRTLKFALLFVLLAATATLESSYPAPCEGECETFCRITQQRFYSTYYFSDGSRRYFVGSNSNCPCIVSYTNDCTGVVGDCEAEDAPLWDINMCVRISPNQPIYPE